MMNPTTFPPPITSPERLHRRITPVDFEEIVAMICRGYTLSEIAVAVGRTESAVSSLCSARGLRPTYLRRAHNATPVRPTVADRFTPAEWSR